MEFARRTATLFRRPNGVRRALRSPLHRCASSKWWNEYEDLPFWHEELNRYEDGRYVPTYLGDVLGDRYRVLRKLGNGGFTQVWLAKDQQLGGHGYVSIKIIPTDTREAKVLKHLKQCRAPAAGDNNVISLLDYFPIHTPNRTYEGLVLEVMGPNVWYVINDLEDLSFDTSRYVSKQVAQGLEYLHRNGICHGDLHTGNVCVTTSRLNGLGEDQVTNLLGGEPETHVLKRKDGQPPPPYMPRHIVEPQSFPRNGWEVKIIDPGSAFFVNDKPEKVEMPDYLRAPEILKPQTPLEWDHRIDLWCFGNLVYELFGGHCPFRPLLGNRQPDSYAWMINGTIGELPKHLRPRFNFEDFINIDGTPKKDRACSTLEELLLEQQELPKGEMTRERMREFIKFVRKAMAIDPEDRVSAGDLAEDPWLRNCSPGDLKN